MSDICKFELFLKKRCYNAYLLTGIERLILREESGRLIE